MFGECNLSAYIKWPVELSKIASAGYYVALRVGFAFPVEERNEFPNDWIEYYTKNGLMLRDPAVRWAYDNSGATRWSEINGTEDSYVSAMAKEYGLKFGAVVCCSSSQPKEQRSYGTFARADREFSEQEISRLLVHIKQLHELAAPPTNLTVAELEALKLVKDGMRLKVVAHHIGVTEGAIKQRLASAKRKLRAKTNTHAASIAVEFRLI